MCDASIPHRTGYEHAFRNEAIVNAKRETDAGEQPEETARDDLETPKQRTVYGHHVAKIYSDQRPRAGSNAA